MIREDIENSPAYLSSKAAIKYSQQLSGDDTLRGEIIETFEEGAEYGYKIAIDKVCEWLDNELPKYIMEGRAGKPYISVAMIDEFKKAMHQ